MTHAQGQIPIWMSHTQVLPHDGMDEGGEHTRPAETPRYPGERRGGTHDPFRKELLADVALDPYNAGPQFQI